MAMLNRQENSPLPVTGEGGWAATAYPAASEERAGVVLPRLLIRPDDGGAPVLVPAEMVRRQEDGTYYLPLTRSMAVAYTAQGESPSVERGTVSQEAAPTSDTERIVIPILEETLFVGKQMVETGKGVRVTKTVRETTEIVDEPLLREEVTVERVPVNQVLDSFPAPRQEGETMIIPIVEEVLVIEKRLLLKEEVRITRQNRIVHQPQEVTLRHEEAMIEQITAEKI